MSANLIQPQFLQRHKLAAVDVGTNTLRLLIADVDSTGQVTSLHTERDMVRLGQGLAASGSLCDEAMDRAIVTMRRFAEAIGSHAPEQVVAMATSAVREADNGQLLIDRFREEVGVDVAIINGEEEARLTSIGAGAVLTGDLGNLMITDIGGGSTELIQLVEGQIRARVSVPLGVVTATERCLTADPPSARELYDLDDHIRDHMQVVRRALPSPGRARLVATAGTPTTLAAIDQEMQCYDPDKINNYVLTLDRVEELYGWLSGISIAERSRITGIEPGREELILSGCAILLRVMHDYQFASVTVSDWGLREGMILDLFEQVSS